MLSIIYLITKYEFHIRNSYDALSSGGFLIFQFIEKDLYLNRKNDKRLSYKFSFNELQSASTEMIYGGEDNPIRLLDIDWLIDIGIKAGFKIKSSKTVLESYTLDESFYRIDRYLMFQK